MNAFPIAGPIVGRAWQGGRPFRKYYHDVFRPAAVVRLTESQLKSYDQAVAALLAWRGQSVRLADVADELLLGEFIASAETVGRSKPQRRKLAGCLRQVVLTWRPRVVRKPRQQVDPLPPARPGTVRHYFASVYRPEVLIGAKLSTIEDYERCFRLLAEHVGHDPPWGKLTDRLAAEFFQALLVRGLAASTVNRYRRLLFAVWRHAAIRGRIDRQPQIKKLKEVRHVPDAWRVDEMKAILAAAGGFRAEQQYGPIPCGLWWKAVLLVCYQTALRRASLLTIRREDVNLSTGLLHVPGERMKNRQGQVYQLDVAALHAIEDIWLPRRELLFECPHDPSHISREFGHLIHAAGVQPGRRKRLAKFHKLRRSVATYIAARAGIAVASTLLGHSSEYVTKLYVDPSQLPKHDVTKILPNLTGDLSAAG